MQQWRVQFPHFLLRAVHPAAHHAYQARNLPPSQIAPPPILARSWTESSRAGAVTLPAASVTLSHAVSPRCSLFQPRRNDVGVRQPLMYNGGSSGHWMGKMARMVPLPYATGCQWEGTLLSNLVAAAYVHLPSSTFLLTASMASPQGRESGASFRLRHGNRGCGGLSTTGRCSSNSTFAVCRIDNGERQKIESRPNRRS